MTNGSNGEKKVGLTFRSFVVALFALFLMSAWIQFVERFCTSGPLAENWPPNSVVGAILVVMAISGLLYFVRRPLRLSAPELVVIYSALLVAAPLNTQGMWSRFFGLVSSIPHHEDFKSYESLPKNLWPHGPNVVANNRFEKGLEGYTSSGTNAAVCGEADVGRGRKWKTAVIDNGNQETARSSLTFEVAAADVAGRPVLIPRERMLLSLLVKASQFQQGSYYSLCVVSGKANDEPLVIQTMATKPTYALPTGFQRIGVSPITIPEDLKGKLAIRITLNGPGRIEVTDLELMNVEAVEGLFSGREMVREENLSTLGPDERNFTVVKPRNMFSLAGLNYLLHGYIPLKQWLMPAIVWTLLIGALFAGFLGINMLMLRQWSVAERFSFPQTLLPKNLFAEREDGQGGVAYSLFRNRIFWLGFAVAFPLVLLQGLNFYNPAVPAMSFTRFSMADYFNSPLAKAYFGDIVMGGGGIGMTINVCVLAIALLIETNVLFSLWACYLLFQLWNLFGLMFNFNRFPGYPWASQYSSQQAMGGFIAFAGVALYMGRRHLKDVMVRVFRRAVPGDTSPVAKDMATYRVALLLVMASLVALGSWGIWTEMGLGVSLLFFGYMLVLGFASSKIRAECGAPYSYLTPYFGMQFVGAIGGFAVFGPKGMLVATIASGFMTVSCFLLMAPAQIEMFELGNHFGVRRRDVVGGLVLGLLGGLFLGGFSILCWAYGFGAERFDYWWPYDQDWYFLGFRAAEMNADRAFEAGNLFSIPQNQPLNFLSNVDAKGMGIGAVITVILAVLRGLFTWFPLHPLGYVLASSNFMKGFIFMAFIAWVIRVVVLRLGGAQRIRNGLVPFCLGMFLAAVASVILFTIAGVVLLSQGITNIYLKLP